MIEIHNMKHTPFGGMPYDFMVDRSSPVGNPYQLLSEATRDLCINAYGRYFEIMVRRKIDREFMNYLRLIYKAYIDHGEVRLFCWCAPKRCHAEVIRDFIISMLP